MDKERKRKLKKLGKDEVQRRSDELHARLNEANPLDPGEPGWAENYKRGTERERWLKKKLPTLHQPRLEKLFVVREYDNVGWAPHKGGYIQCQICGSAVPSVRPNRFIDYTGCKCKNIFWWKFLKWGSSSIKFPEKIAPVKLTGRG
ncbi:MAG: hypothetical protein JAZ17_17515 [Candidatus Thiodiazotropha endolucinida]|nr:hypothetical protein [Candidatus Thiodiazotropha endolucinida]